MMKQVVLAALILTSIAGCWHGRRGGGYRRGGYYQQPRPVYVEPRPVYRAPPPVYVGPRY